MFGLMKARSCLQANELKLHRRLHYCGTCKTLGSLYGQKTRLLLNHDTVFLAEVLSAISSKTDSLKSWQHAYQSFNCLALPDKSNALPVALQLAATATVILTEFKIADHLNDSKRRVWKSARQLFSKSFHDATQQLLGWQFPLEELQQALLSQEIREANALKSIQSTDTILDDLAEPTAIATALFCRHGARLVGQTAHEETLYALGYNLGAIAYLIDAIEDYEKDLRTQNFNAIGAAYKISAAKMSAEICREMAKRIGVLQANFEAALMQLPLSETMRAMFAGRLQTNLLRKLGGLLPVLDGNHLRRLHSSDMQHSQQTCKTTVRTCKTKLTVSERWQNALSFGRELANRPRQTNSTSFARRFTARLSKPLVFASVLPFAFFAPQQITGTESYGECLSLGLNLMFIGSVLSSIAMWLAKPLRFSAPYGQDSGNFGGQMPPQFDPNQPSGIPPQTPGRRKRRSGGSGNSNCSFCCIDADCCDCCDCCDGCSGCDCNCCDGCDCNCCDC
jgi:hypothetical protein